MTIGELIAILESYPKDIDVSIGFDDMESEYGVMVRGEVDATGSRFVCISNGERLFSRACNKMYQEMYGAQTKG